jgi:hypothetical protein
MSLVTGYHFFLFYVSVTCSGLLLLPCVLLMHFLMPKAVLNRYWREPHMRCAELALFTDTIYAPMRTVMLMWVIAFPRFGKKRGITEADRLVPRWYRTIAKVLSVWLVAAGGISVVLTVGVFIHGYATGDPVPLTRGR